jgi:predicted amidohydrolase YtcJ
MHRHPLIGLFLLLAGLYCVAVGAATQLYTGGPILTMNDRQPEAGAVAVRDGVILAVGDAAALRSSLGDEPEVVDLAGRTLLPGFFDSHGHAYGIGLQATSANLLPPPDGPVTSIPDLQHALRDYLAASGPLVQSRGWVVGFGYDDSQLAEQRHPTRQ